MNKKLLPVLLAMVLIAGMLAGCTGATATPAAIESPAATATGSADQTAAVSSPSAAAPLEDYTIELLVPGTLESKSSENAVGKVFYDKFKIQFNVVNYAGDWGEKSAMMLAGGDYTDMTWLQSGAMVRKYIGAGAVLDIGQLAEQYAPNFLAFYKDTIPYWKLMTDTDKLYCWTANTPDYECDQQSMFDMCVRSDILEQQGWPKVLDEDSYIKLLTQGVKDNPTTDGQPTLGMSMQASEDWVINGTMTQMYDKGKYTEAAGNGVVIWNDQTKQYEDLVHNSYFKAGVKFFNRLYQAGALDPECFTDNSAQHTEKMNSGRVLSSFYTTWDSESANPNLDKLGHENMEYVRMPIMLSEQLKNGDKRIIRILDVYDWQSLVITKNAKHPERIMELINWACTPENQVLIGWGIEGKHYTINSEGKRQVTQDYIDCCNGVNADKHFNDGVGTYGFLGLSCSLDKNGQCYNVIMDESTNNNKMTKRMKEVYSHYGWNTVTDPWKKNTSFGYDYFHTGLVAASISLDPDSDPAKLEVKLIDYRKKNMAKLIMCESDDAFEAAWSEFVKGHDAQNPQSVIDAHNARYADVDAKFKAVS